MTHSPLSLKFVGALVLTGLAFAWCRPCPGQDGQPAPNVADLERRVRELEEIIRQMQAGKLPATPPAAAPQAPAGDVLPEIVIPQTGQTGAAADNPCSEG